MLVAADSRAADGIGREVGEQVVGELRRAVAQGQEVADLGDELPDGAGERRTGLLGELVQEEGQRVVGGVDGSCGRGGRQPRPGRVQDDVGAGLGAEEHPQPAVQRGVERLAPGRGADHAEVEIEGERRSTGAGDPHGGLEAGGEPAERGGGWRGELRRVDERRAAPVSRRRRDRTA